MNNLEAIWCPLASISKISKIVRLIMQIPDDKKCLGIKGYGRGDEEYRVTTALTNSMAIAITTRNGADASQIKVDDSPYDHWNTESSYIKQVSFTRMVKELEQLIPNKDTTTMQKNYSVTINEKETAPFEIPKNGQTPLFERLTDGTVFLLIHENADVFERRRYGLWSLSEGGLMMSSMSPTHITERINDLIDAGELRLIPGGAEVTIKL